MGLTWERLESFNETDVREEIIAPFLRSLGYRSGTENNIIREQSLRYPRSSLGRKNPAKDPELRGKADYILDIQNLVRWTIEAKAPAVLIAQQEIEQAWTYANHPEVRAVYFALCNGRVLQVFQTQNGPEVGPILTVGCEEFESGLASLMNVLGPIALLRDFPHRPVDQKPPLGPGLRSVVRISQGWIRYDRNSLGNVALNQLQTTISFGAVERGDDGRLIAYLETIAPMRSLHELNERLGLSAFEMRSEDSVLSIDARKPTRFTNSQRVVLPAGVPVLDFTSWRQVSLPVNVNCETSTVAEGTLTESIFSGKFKASMRFVELRNLIVDLDGAFEVHLS